MEDTGKLEERNKIVSDLQTIIKERIELKEIEISTLTPIEALNVLNRLQNRLKNRW